MATKKKATSSTSKPKETVQQRLAAAAARAKEIEKALPGQQDEILGGIIRTQKPLDRLREKYPLYELPSTEKKEPATVSGSILEDAVEYSLGGPGAASSLGTPLKKSGTYTAPDGTTFTDQMAYATYLAALKQEEFDRANQMADRKSAFSILKEEFDRYGLGDLVGDVESLARQGLSASEYSMELRKLPTYKERFKANEARINSGLRALSEAEYVSLEDQYQQVMRQYGLPKSFYSTGKMGRQPELEKFIAGDVSPVELEDRVQLAVDRVKNAAPEVVDALTKYYGGPGGISQSNLVAYVLDPERALPEIKRKIQAAEIGAAAQVAGATVGSMRAEELAARGVTQQQAQQGYQTIAELTPQAGKLANIYGGEQYDQIAAEQEVFGLSGAASARRKRQRLSGLEQGQFSQQTGMSAGALERNRSGAF